MQVGGTGSPSDVEAATKLAVEFVDKKLAKLVRIQNEKLQNLSS